MEEKQKLVHFNETVLKGLKLAEISFGEPHRDVGLRGSIEILLGIGGRYVLVNVFAEFVFTKRPKDSDLGFTASEAEWHEGVCMKLINPETKSWTGSILSCKEFFSSYQVDTELQAYIVEQLKNIKTHLRCKDFMMELIDETYFDNKKTVH